MVPVTCDVSELDQTKIIVDTVHAEVCKNTVSKRSIINTEL